MRKNAPPTGETFLVEEGGFEPPKRIATDLQSAPLATRELLRMNLLELVDGLEPPTG